MRIIDFKRSGSDIDILKMIQYLNHIFTTTQVERHTCVAAVFWPIHLFYLVTIFDTFHFMLGLTCELD